MFWHRWLLEENMVLQQPDKKQGYEGMALPGVLSGQWEESHVGSAVLGMLTQEEIVGFGWGGNLMRNKALLLSFKEDGKIMESDTTR